MSNSANIESTRPPGPAPKAVALDVPVIAVRNSPRHMFDFVYDGKECHCFVLSKQGMTAELQVGQTVRLVGQWSTAIRQVFDAAAVTVLE